MNLNGEFENIEQTGVEEENEEVKPFELVNATALFAAEEAVFKEVQEAFFDLNDVCASIDASGGMSQQIAQEAQKVIENFINEEMPIGYFTKQPSATHLRYALEELDSKYIAVIVAAIAAAIGVAYKIYKWFTKDSKTSEKSDKEIKETVEKRTEVVSNIAEAVSSYDKEVSREYSIDELVSMVAKNDPESKASKATLRVDGIMFDILSPSSMILKRTGELIQERNLGSHLTMVHETVKDLERLATDNLFSREELRYQETRKQLKRIVEKTHLSQNQSLYEMGYLGHNVPTGKIVEDLRRTFETLKSGGLKSIVNYSDALDRFLKIKNDVWVTNFIHLHKRFIELIVVIQDYLEMTQKEVEEQSRIFPPIDPNSMDFRESSPREMTNKYSMSAEERQELLSVITALNREQMNLQTIYLYIEEVYFKYMDGIERIFRGTLKEIEKELKQMKMNLEAGRSSASQQKIEELEKAQALFKEKFGSFK